MKYAIAVVAAPTAIPIATSMRIAPLRTGGESTEPKGETRAVLGGRQLERERGADVLARVEPDAPVHAVHERTADVEAESRPAHAAGQVRVEAVELLEDVITLGGGDAEALVLDGEAHAPGRLLDAHLDRASV